MKNDFDIEILDKENYWDPLFKENPIMAEKFQDWIDAYKKENCWKGLFPNMDGQGRYCYPDEIKFHDLPIHMQFGIFLEFTNSIHDEIYGPDTDPYLVDNMIKDYFVDHEEVFKSEADSQTKTEEDDEEK